MSLLKPQTIQILTKPATAVFVLSVIFGFASIIFIQNNHHSEYKGVQGAETLITRRAPVKHPTVTPSISPIHSPTPAPKKHPTPSYIKSLHTLVVQKILATPTNPPAVPTIIPPVLTPTTTTPKIIFGVGPEADKVINSRIVVEAPTKMLTSWYNGPQDLPWITEWKNNFIPSLYAKGYVLHLITFTDLPEGPVDTKYGPACGRAYPVSSGFADDMKQLAQAFSGNGSLYVTLMTEFQTYPCQDNSWKGNENYFNALKDNFRAAVAVFHQYAPNAKVGISWGGWQSRWDDPSTGAGRSLFPNFEDIIKDSDITSFQAMQSDSNVDDIKNMTAILSKYGKPILLSHYRPDNGSQTTFDKDMHTILTDAYLSDVTKNGLFAISFMDDKLFSSETEYQYIKSSITKYAQ